MKKVFWLTAIQFVFGFQMQAQWVNLYVPVTGSLTGIAGLNILIAVSSMGGTVFVSNNNSQSWSQTYNNFTNPYVSDIIATDSHLFTAGNALYLYDNNTQKWNSILSSPMNFFNSLHFDGKKIIAGTGYHGIYISYDNGNTWRLSTNGLLLYQSTPGVYFIVWSLASFDTIIFAGGDGLLAISLNDGNKWTYKQLPGRITALQTIGSKLFIGSRDNGLYISSDTAISWVRVNS